MRSLGRRLRRSSSASRSEAAAAPASSPRARRLRAVTAPPAPLRTRIARGRVRASRSRRAGGGRASPAARAAGACSRASACRLRLPHDRGRRARTRSTPRPRRRTRRRRRAGTRPPPGRSASGPRGSCGRPRRAAARSTNGRPRPLDRARRSGEPLGDVGELVVVEDARCVQPLSVQQRRLQVVRQQLGVVGLEERPRLRRQLARDAPGPQRHSDHPSSASRRRASVMSLILTASCPIRSAAVNAVALRSMLSRSGSYVSASPRVSRIV